MIVSGARVDLMNEYSSWKWTLPELASEDHIDKGIRLVMDYKFPASCGDDFICITFKGLIGPRRLRASLLTTTSGAFTFMAGVTDIPITPKILLTFAGLQLQLSLKGAAKIALVGLLRVNATKTATVYFTSEIGAKLEMKWGSKKETRSLPASVAAEVPHELAKRVSIIPKIYLKGTLEGIWKRAFGLSWFSIGNAVMQFTFTATSPIFGLPIPIQYLIGVEIALGNPDLCYPVKPIQKVVCAEWSLYEKVEIMFTVIFATWFQNDPDGALLNAAVLSAERTICDRSPNRNYTESIDESVCGCRCCELTPNPPTPGACVSAAGYVASRVKQR